MNDAMSEPLPRRIVDVRRGIWINADMQEICSFTLERCFLTSKPTGKGEAENVCPFTLEPVCIKTRALPAAWD